MTQTDHHTEPGHSLGPSDRLTVLRELAATAVDVACIDAHFQPVGTPEPILALGFRPWRWADEGLARPLARVHGDDQPTVIGLVGAARSTGAATARVRFTDRPDGEVLHVIDGTDLWGVFVFVRGGASGRLTATLPSTVTVKPRRMVHRRDAAAVFTSVDDNTTSILGWAASDLIGTSAVELLHPDDVDRAVDAWLAMLGGHSGDPVRLRYREIGGGHRWFEVHNANHLGDPTRGYVETELIDIDAEMQALARVRDSEMQFAGLAASLPVGVLQFDAEGRVSFANDWMQRMTGGDITHIGSFSWVAERNRQPVVDAIRRAIEQQRDDDLEMMVSAVDRGIRVCRLRLRPLTSASGSRGGIASVEDITASLDLQERLRTQALTDPLTGLPNRRALHFWLAEQQTGRPLTLLFVDLDEFKIINDALGHDFGDAFLIGVAALIRGAVRPDDFVARLGGDEFVVGCVGIEDPSEAAEIANRVLGTLQDEPLMIDERPVVVGCSIGIAVARPDQSPSSLIGDADLAMYEAKRAGGHRYIFYEEGQRRGVEDRLRQADDLRSSIAEGRFELYVQPLVDLATGETVGHESLVRWNHPTRGLLLPGQFIEAAERTGLIQALGAWILDDACRLSAAYEARGLPSRMAVNVSPVQLIDPNFPAIVHDALAVHSISPTNLVLEVTETVFLDTDVQVLGTIDALVGSGVRIALDDFGTGYSSLNHLRLLPSQIVKIDRSYTADVGVDPGATAILEAMVDLAGRLGQDLVVEGIETTAQAELIRAMGVRYGQGYLFGRPAPASDLLLIDRVR